MRRTGAVEAGYVTIVTCKTMDCDLLEHISVAESWVIQRPYHGTSIDDAIDIEPGDVVAKVDG